MYNFITGLKCFAIHIQGQNFHLLLHAGPLPLHLLQLQGRGGDHGRARLPLLARHQLHRQLQRQRLQRLLQPPPGPDADAAS